MTERIHINPTLIAWARERSGMSNRELIAKFSSFSEWETGASSPTYVQLEKLAQLFKIPVAVFFFPEPPDLPPIGQTFRTLPKSEIDSLSRAMHMLLRKAKSFQLNLEELNEGKNSSRHLITRELYLSNLSNLTDFAKQVREYLGVSLEEQKSWKNVDVALKEWRTVLYKVGIFIFKDAFKDDAYSGFCLYDDEFPIIFVNNSATPTRQIFTYFHELAHLLFHTSGIDKIDDDYIGRLNSQDKNVEVYCNQFAAEFLMPQTSFLKITSNLPASEDVAESVATQFHVSREVVYRRFLDLGRISSVQYSNAVQKWTAQKNNTGESGGNFYWSKLTYLGKDYVSLAFKSFHRNEIDEYQLAEYLDIKPKSLNKLEEYFSKGP